MGLVQIGPCVHYECVYTYACTHLTCVCATGRLYSEDSAAVPIPNNNYVIGAWWFVEAIPPVMQHQTIGEPGERRSSMLRGGQQGPYGVITLVLWLESNGGMPALPNAASFLPTSKGLVNYHVNCLLYEERPASPSVRHSNEHKKCFLVRMGRASKDYLIIHEQSGILNQLSLKRITYRD